MKKLLRSVLPASLALLMLPLAANAAQPAPPTPQLLSTLPLGGPGGWDYLSFDAPHRHLFVSRGDRVLVIDVDQNKQIGTIANTAGVHGIALAPDLHRGFISDGKAASVTEFDLDSLKTVATIEGTGLNPDAILYDSASHHVFTFNGKGHSASVIDPAKGTVIATIDLPGKPEFAVSDGAGHIYNNIEDKSELVEIDTHSNKVLHVWPLAPCESPSGLAFDVPHHRLFSVCDNQVMAVTDALDGHHVATVPIGEGPDAVEFDAAESMIYSSNGQSGTITAVHEDNADHYSVSATIPTQTSARTLTLDPKLHRLYLSAAKLGATRQPNGRPMLVPDSFGILTVGRP
ncbi:YncE family protein [Rhodanobacter sp. AS-Z3]|uniref:YncE family protein n=1 Tax=Rhodanobacter sp. AS-Z3 TaxID=3031330 RepID=UPI00247A06FA|nr:YncE family protein [Rhodanobacter sp. AS-Z3]WEN16522.1 YncE family protein [Rhodanobacter sp. AS-Z3]